MNERTYGLLLGAILGVLAAPFFWWLGQVAVSLIK